MIKYYQAKHILLDDHEDCDFVMNKLNNGESFENLAKDFSECETANKGGSLGRFKSGTMVPEFEKALYSMKVGEIKSHIKTKHGYHIILREE